MNKEYLRKLFWCIIGCILIGIGTAFLNVAKFGNDPYSAMLNSYTLFWSSVNISWLQDYKFMISCTAFNLIALIPMIIFMRKKINIGTLLNVVGVGYVVDLIMLIFKALNMTVDLALWARIICVIIGFLTECFGVALFVQSDCGIAPYDFLNLFLGKRITYKYSRIVCDICCTLIAFIISLCYHLDEVYDVGSFFYFLFLSPNDKIGWFTILLFFIGGPTISFMGKFINKHILKNAQANI